MTTAINRAADLPIQFLALNQYLRRSGDVPTAMQRLVELAAAEIPGCRTAAITAWPQGRMPYSIAVSDPVAAHIDALQYSLGEGPCLSTAAEGGHVHATDLAQDGRWPSFSAAARSQTSLRGVMSFRLSEEPIRSAINLYADEVGAFDEDSVAVAVLFASHAQVLMLHADSALRAAQLAQALSTSRVIGSAVGILMSTRKISADEAFELLRAASQRLNRKLRDIADDVASTGALPSELR